MQIIKYILVFISAFCAFISIVDWLGRESNQPAYDERFGMLLAIYFAILASLAA